MDYQSCELLTQMRLSAMRDEYKRQAELPAMAELSFDTRFAMIVQAQHNKRKDNKLALTLKRAKLREPSANLADLDYDAGRNLSKQKIAQLSDMSWVKKGLGLAVTGASGTGKTFVLCAFGREGCATGHTVIYYRMPSLVQLLKDARANNTYGKMLNDMRKPDILILDDFGLDECDHLLSLDLLEIMDSREMAKKSVFFGSQLPVALWGEVLANKTASEAFMERVRNKTYKIELKGPTRRVRPAEIENFDKEDA